MKAFFARLLNNIANAIRTFFRSKTAQDMARSAATVGLNSLQQRLNGTHAGLQAVHA